MEIIIAVAVCIVIYFVQQAVYRKRWSEHLDVSIEFDEDHVSIGDTGYLTEIVCNDKGMPLPSFHIKFNTSRTFAFPDNKNAKITDCYHRNDGFSIMGHQKITRKLEFVTSKRGYYDISGVNITAMDFFMTGSYARKLANSSHIYVLPDRVENVVMEPVCDTLMGEFIARKSIVEDRYSFRGIREYMTGDPMNAINWKATARAGELAVNMYDRSADQKICIMLSMDTESMIRQEYIRELSIRIAGSVAEYFISHHVPVALETNGRDVVAGNSEKVPFGASDIHMLNIDRCLARINCDETSDFSEIVDGMLRNKSTEITYIVVSSYCKEDLLIKLDYAVENGASVYMIAPNFDIAMPKLSRKYIYDMEVILDDV